MLCWGNSAKQSRMPICFSALGMSVLTCSYPDYLCGRMTCFVTNFKRCVCWCARTWKNTLEARFWHVCLWMDAQLLTALVDEVGSIDTDVALTASSFAASPAAFEVQAAVEQLFTEAPQVFHTVARQRPTARMHAAADQALYFQFSGQVRFDCAVTVFYSLPPVFRFWCLRCHGAHRIVVVDS